VLLDLVGIASEGEKFYKALEISQNVRSVSLTESRYHHQGRMSNRLFRATTSIAPCSLLPRLQASTCPRHLRPSEPSAHVGPQLTAPAPTHDLCAQARIVHAVPTAASGHGGLASTRWSAVRGSVSRAQSTISGAPRVNNSTPVTTPITSAVSAFVNQAQSTITACPHGRSTPFTTPHPSGNPATSIPSSQCLGCMEVARATGTRPSCTVPGQTWKAVGLLAQGPVLTGRQARGPAAHRRGARAAFPTQSLF